MHFKFLKMTKSKKERKMAPTFLAATSGLTTWVPPTPFLTKKKKSLGKKKIYVFFFEKKNYFFSWYSADFRILEIPRCDPNSEDFQIRDRSEEKKKNKKKNEILHCLCSAGPLMRM